MEAGKDQSRQHSRHRIRRYAANPAQAMKCPEERRDQNNPKNQLLIDSGTKRKNNLG